MNHRSKTKAHIAWEERVRFYGCVVSGEYMAQCHHVVGFSYKHNKIHIGPWFCIGLSYEWHDIKSTNPNNVTHNRKAFEKLHGEQRFLFQKMINNMLDSGEKLPFDDYIITTIMETNR